MNKVLIRRQNEDFKLVQVEELSLEYMQQVVGGFIERVGFNDCLNRLNIDMWINEEGKLIDELKPTFVIMGNKDNIIDLIMGDVLFTATDGEGNTIGLNDIQIQSIKKYFRKAAVLNDGTIVNIIPA